MENRDKLIVALDYDNLDSVKRLLEILKREAVFYKIGLELFTSVGAKAVEFVKNEGHKVFLDLKFHDIPNTVYGAVKSAGMLGVDMLNVHASGGVEMMKAARKGADEASAVTGKSLDVIAVTILTSLEDKDLRNIFPGRGTGAKKLVIHLAGLAKGSGLDGVVCSGHESAGIKKETGNSFKTVVPGIRLSAGHGGAPSKSAGDQKRIMTPGEAFEAGADYIVVGREITGAADPLEALHKIYKNIEK